MSYIFIYRTCKCYFLYISSFVQLHLFSVGIMSNFYLNKEWKAEHFDLIWRIGCWICDSWLQCSKNGMEISQRDSRTLNCKPYWMRMLRICNHSKSLTGDRVFFNKRSLIGSVTWKPFRSLGKWLQKICQKRQNSKKNKMRVLKF